jgi:acetyl esterase/lipase
MLILKITGFVFLIYGLLLLLVPKGNFLYELLRLPAWVYRMKTYPVGNYRETKHFYGKHFRQYLLFFLPKTGEPARRHIVVYLHGGGWQFGRPEMFRPNAQALVDHGYAVFMPSHRRIPFCNCRHLRSDVARAMVKVVEIMRAEGLAGLPIILGGMSSGGNLAGLLAFDGSLLKSVGLSRAIFSAVFLLGAPLNLRGMWSSPPLWLLGGKRSGGMFREANPMDHLEPGYPTPVLLLHSEQDGLVEFDSVRTFYREMKNHRAKSVRFESLPGAIHTDAASWCFQGHPSCEILFGWLEEIVCPKN